MLTIKAEIRKGQKRSDGSFNVKLRFTMNRRVIRKSTEFYVQSADLTSNLTLRDGSEVKVRVDSLVVYLQKRYVELSLTDTSYSLEEVISILYSGNEEKEGIDFIKFSENWIANTDVKGAKNYQSAINAFKEYLGKDTLEVQLMDRKMLLSFCQYLRDKHQKKAETLIKEGKRVPSERASSLYLGSLRHLFKEAKLFYNDYDRDIIRITNDPFQNFTVPQQNATRKRTLPKEKICKISKLPYKTTQEGRLCGRCAYNLAKDCFILSFCLMGMNSVDLFNALPAVDGYIVYNRTKTKDRRLDSALMKVKIPSVIKPLIEKYRDPIGIHMFNFYKAYNTEKNFNRAINHGLKEIGDALDIDDLEFYAARHSWATIALNKCKIDKFTVHAALNHVDPSMRVTDIYIERDFVNENDANRKVVKYVLGR